ncbi:alpha-glycerophosphate oxidase, partial [Klebsiella oxytoca]
EYYEWTEEEKTKHYDQLQTVLSENDLAYLKNK